MPNRIRKILTKPVLLGVLLFTMGLATHRVWGQAREELKQRAEQQLQSMTADEIDAKLKSLGLSRWEAIRKAQDLGIPLEQYLARTDTTALQVTPQAALPAAVAPETAPVSRAAVRQLRVPGFMGRKGMDTTLAPFGYDIFRYPPSTFEPVLNAPTPQSYVLGPGDEVVLSVWGETTLYYQLAVNRDGNVVVPEVGPIQANGSTIEQLRKRLLLKMTDVYSGLKRGQSGASSFLDLSLGKLRTVLVYVLGEVERPGGYNLSSVSTMFHALYLAGGPTVRGSLRQVRLVRDKKEYKVLDSYDYILRGDNSSDVRLQDGDIVYVPPAGPRVALVGRVVRPAIYELKPAENLSVLIALAGGLRFDAYVDRIHIDRVIPFEQRAPYAKDVLDIDLNFKGLSDLQKSKHTLSDGDIVRVFTVGDFRENQVEIYGNVRKPGVFELKPGMRISDLITDADSLEEEVLDRGILFRILPDRRREALRFNPILALAGDSEHNLSLQNEDSVLVYRKSDYLPKSRAAITGAIRNPNFYPRAEGMTLNDLVLIAGGLTEDAELSGWEVSRLDTTKVGVYTKVIRIDTPFEYWGDAHTKEFLLQDNDYVFVPFNPRFQVQKFVDVQGYVMFPGPYPIRFAGERLVDIINRAGGLRPGAYLQGSILVRRGGIGERIATGPVDIDFQNAIDDPNSRDNISLHDRDSIFVAQLEDVVRVFGEVHAPSAVLYEKGASLKYYLQQAGGVTDNGEESKVVVALPGGKKWEPGWWVFPDPDILPGSRIYVPRKVEREDKTLPIIRDMATILASLAAITVALVQVTK